MVAACLLVLPLLLQGLQGLQGAPPPSAAAARSRLHPEQMGPLAVMLYHRLQQHRDRDPLLMGDFGADLPMSDEIGDTKEFPASPASSGEGDATYMRPSKRQVRYYQCYFNPISCFG